MVQEPEGETAPEDVSSSDAPDPPAGRPAGAPAEQAEAGRRNPAEEEEKQAENPASEGGEQPKGGDEEEKSEPPREESDKEEAQGTKRKREDEVEEEAGPSTEKKKVRTKQFLASQICGSFFCPAVGLGLKRVGVVLQSACDQPHFRSLIQLLKGCQFDSRLPR